MQAIDKIKARIQTLYREFDGEVHDGLDKDAVGKVMARLKTEQYRDSNPPTPEAVEWIMRSSDVSGTGKLRLKELEHAIHVYSGYLRHKAHIDDVFERFDADGDGQLDRDELRAYVRADLNDGVDPTEEDLDAIIAKCDVGGLASEEGDGKIGRSEIVAVKDEWFFAMGGGARRRSLSSESWTPSESDDDAERKVHPREKERRGAEKQYQNGTCCVACVVQ